MNITCKVKKKKFFLCRKQEFLDKRDRDKLKVFNSALLSELLQLQFLNMATGCPQIGLRTTATFFLPLCLPHLFIANEIYHPDDLYSINCVSSNNLSDHGRSWTADTNTKLLLEASSSVDAEALTPTTIEGPFDLARLSYS